MTVGMVRLVSVVMWALQVLPARKVHRVNGAPPVRTDPMVKTVRMAARWCLCTVPGAAWLCNIVTVWLPRYRVRWPARV